MRFYAYFNGVETLILDTEVDNMAKYDKADAAEVARQRRADIVARKPLLPKQACHYCGYSVPKLAHWCSSECANLFSAERDKILMSPPVAGSAVAQEPAE